MTSILGNRKTIFDIVQEADEDTANDIINGSVDNNSDQTSEAPADNNVDTGATDNNDNQENNDDDLNVDASLNDLDNFGDDNSGADATTGGDSSVDSGSSMDSSSSGGSEDEEPIKNNTDIFTNLTSEEQSIKIMELKRLYNDLYTTADDLLDKVNNLSVDNIRIEILSKISRAMYNLKIYIKDYIEKQFAIRSYIENDCKYNEFLYVYNGISSILEDVIKNNKDKDKK